jgi:hypothetical protein
MRCLLLFFLLCFSAIAKADDPPSLEIRNVEFSASKLNLNDSSVAITITLYAFSLESEVTYAFGNLYQPIGYPSTHYKYFSFRDWSLTNEENIYTSSQTIIMGQNSAPGFWRLQVSSLQNKAGNRVSNINSDDLESMGITSTIEVLNDNEIDVTPPSFANIEFSTTEVDLINGENKVTVTITLKDEKAPVVGATIVFNPSKGIPESHTRYYTFQSYEWIQGEEENTYVGTKVINFTTSTFANGIWGVSINRLTDEHNNQTIPTDYLSSEALDTRGVNPYLTVINSSALDIEAPKFSGLTFSSQYIDVSSGDQAVNITVEVTDDNKPAASYFVLQDPTGERRVLWFSNWKKGTENNHFLGSSSFTFNDTHMSGFWQVSEFYLQDGFKNRRQTAIGPRELLLRGIDPYIRVNVTDEDVSDLSIEVEGEQYVYLDEVLENVFSIGVNQFDAFSGELEFVFELVGGLRFAGISMVNAEVVTNSCHIFTTYGSCRATSENWNDAQFLLKTKIKKIGKHSVTAGIFFYEDSLENIELDLFNNSTTLKLSTINYPASESDFDGDGIKNDLDMDDDADGIPDVVEEEFGLDSQDHDDGMLDLDGDGVSNSAEYLAGTDMKDITESPTDKGFYTSFDYSNTAPLNISSNYTRVMQNDIDDSYVIKRSFTANDNNDLVLRLSGQMEVGTLSFASKMEQGVSFVILINGESTTYDSKIALGDSWYYYRFEVDTGFSDIEIRFIGDVDQENINVLVDDLFIPIKPRALVPGDFDGDGRAEIAMRNPLNYQNYWKELSQGDFNEQKFGGQRDDIPVNGDFDGDGKADWAIRRRSNQTWYVKQSSNDEVISKHFGKEAGDIPVAADYDGDGITDFAIRRPSNSKWYILQSSDGKLVVKRFGLQRTDVPVPADYDGDGKADIAVRRPSNGTWYVLRSLDNKVEVTRFGVQANDIPVPADYDGDGNADIAVRRAADSTWYILQSSDKKIRKVRFGIQVADIPVVSDYDGDGKADIAVRRSSSYMWFVLLSSTNEVYSEEFGRSAKLVPLLAPILQRLSMTRNVSAKAKSDDYLPVDDGYEDRLEYIESTSVVSPEFKGKETLETVTEF